MGCVVTVSAPSLASQLLQLIAVVRGFCVRRRPPVGAGLPAKAAAHSTLMQADPPLSLASQLLQLIAVVHGFCVRVDSVTIKTA
jgi:hypothetical protein